MNKKTIESRREFLKFMGTGAALISFSSFLPSCSLKGRGSRSSLPFTPISPSDEDTLLLAAGFSYKVLIRQGDPINSKGDRFGSDCDFTCFIPSQSGASDEGLLWVNHEAFDSHLMGILDPKSRKDVLQEQKEVGGSILKVKRDSSDASWRVVFNDPLNRRLDATTKIPIISDRPIAGKKLAIGTLANCSGGLTPWNSILTCEENYQNFYGSSVRLNQKNPPSGWSAVFSSRGKRYVGERDQAWYDFFDYPPEHYGWVVEVEPFTGRAKKLTAMGRFCHEGATTILAKDSRPVVYMGDDGNDECLYKFIASVPGSLDQGKLYVANIEKGKWIPLDIKTSSELRESFVDQTDLLIHTREAAILVGGTRLNRPEDIEIHPETKNIFVALTNNKKKSDDYGRLLKIEEKDNDPLALEFHASTFISGGLESGFACPDNLAFDRKGNLWMVCDMSGTSMNKPPYEKFKNNGLFYIPMSGPDMGIAFQVGSAPKDAELTGPWFSPDGRSLFLSVQHPGETSSSAGHLTSHWPDGGSSLPRSSVVVIEGPALEKLTV